mgnify:CR=1 FL=1
MLPPGDDPLAVDDDVPVLAAVERDLRDRYAEHYQIVTATSGDQALDLLRRLRLREDTPHVRIRTEISRET